MTPDEEIPGTDPLAHATRRALARLGDTPALDELSWGAVQTRARRVKTQRITALVAACAIVVVGVGAAAATTKRGSDHVSVAGRGEDSTTISASTTTTIAATTTTTTTAPPVVTPTRPFVQSTAPLNETPTTAPAADQVLQAQDGSWSAAVSADATSVTVGDDFTVSAELTNTGTQPQSTVGYASWAIACSWADSPGGPTGLVGVQIGAFPDGAIVRPGESQTVSHTFHADESFAGKSLRCGAGIVSHGDAPFAADTGNGVIVDVVAAPVTTTTFVTTEPTTTTTAP